MKRIFIFLTIITTLFSCKKGDTQETIVGSVTTLNNAEELKNAIKEAKPGDELVLANGVWKDVEIKFTSKGTEDKPITLRAETAGKVFIEGKSYLKFGGEHLVVSGLYFRNGYTPSNAVIDFKVKKDQVGNYCRVTNCVIEDFNQLKRDIKDHWVEFWGRHNQLDHCYIAGKSNEGPTVRVEIKGNRNIKNFHQIVNNHFGPRPRKGGPRGETIQLGDSFSSMSPSNTTIANNLFEECNGEVEIISSKTNFNIFKNNVFYKSEGSLVTRHGNYATIDGNYFIGDGVSENYGGIRLINTGHTVINNYFYNIKGKNFRSPLAVMNGIPKSPLNRYNQVTDVTVAYNTWVNCDSPLQFGVGTNVSQKDVLPLSEIRSAKPIRTVVANNIIYNEKGDATPVVAHDSINGVKFKNNIINNQGVSFEGPKGLKEQTIAVSKINDYLLIPKLEGKEEVYNGFGFDEIKTDLFGNSREESNAIGAVSVATTTDPFILDKKKYGTDWFSNEKPETKAKTIEATTAAGDLAAKIAGASDGDIISLSPGEYTFDSSLVINKTITIQSKNADEKAQLLYVGKEGTPAFEMNPKGNLFLNNVVIKGQNTQYAFASLKENMSSLYNVTVDGAEISNFDYVLKAYKQTFSDDIIFKNSTLKDCANGIELSQETNDKGDYNVEFLTIDNCQFDNIASNVIDYYRGGYDESTIGGNLSVTNSTFTNSGSKETNGILLNHRGIVNVNIAKNTFKNNRVKLVAMLWGAKNNTHADNEIVNSGKLIVEENIKLKLMY
ncbi:chondroitinase-B domain-containing protein [Aquimarina pacifica]|uniref:chondroitinase-B domain-containing protein n=1 Tax=Aquimarina pacifica TaxID=1296415 RepID=UPI000471598B|nr:chondroitinase-B domain-containing protein [Aquimarina pacifica]